VASCWGVAFWNRGYGRGTDGVDVERHLAAHVNEDGFTKTQFVIKSKNNFLSTSEMMGPFPRRLHAAHRSVAPSVSLLVSLRCTLLRFRLGCRQGRGLGSSPQSLATRCTGRWLPQLSRLASLHLHIAPSGRQRHAGGRQGQGQCEGKYSQGRGRLVI
jgi:hypothetical protein